MSDQGGEGTPAPEAMVRVQPISDPKAFKRHLLRTFEQGQPHYAYADELDAAPWKLWPEMVSDFVEGWQLIDTDGRGPKRSVIALALTFSMPVGTDPAVNEAAVLAMARKAFAGHDQIWVAGEYEGPFVKLLVQYWNDDGRALSSGPADLRRYREVYVRELGACGVVAQATTRGSRGLGYGKPRNNYKSRERSTSE